MHNILRYTISTFIAVVIVCLNGWTEVSLMAQNSDQDYSGYLSSMHQNYVNKNNSIIPLTELLASVEQNYRVSFLYEKYLLANKYVNRNQINMEEETGRELSEILNKLGFTYQQVDEETYVILGKTPDKEVLVLQQEITGVVTDANTGEALPGVNIVVQGTNIGTTTDVEGNYQITVPSLQETLIFSYIGFEIQVIPIDGREEIHVILVPQTISGDELVVVGYGTQRRADVTGSIASLREGDFNRGVSLAPEQLMQGRIPGVSIVQSSGRPGAASNVRIRGESSISAGNDPLYVVDGVPLQLANEIRYVNVAGESTTSPFSSNEANPLNFINAADIESIDVLKDASATAIYGSRGANGVIIITTKNYSETATVTYDTNIGVSTVSKKLPFLSADEFRNIAQSQNLDFTDRGANTNWQDEIFRTAVSQNHNISLGGASGSTNYRVSIGYSDQEGIASGSQFTRYSGRLNITHRALDERLRVGLNLTNARISEERVPISSNIGNEGGNMLKDALRWAPTLPVRLDDGSFFQVGELRVNPVSWPDLIDRPERNTLLGDVRATLQIHETLNATVNLGHTNEFIDRYNYVPGAHPLGANEGGRAAISKLQNENSLIETNLNYTNTIGPNSNLSVLAGYSYQRFIVQSTFQSAHQFPSDAPTYTLIQSGTMLNSSSSRSTNALASVYGRVNLQLNNKYMFTFTLRNDGSSRFGENNQWGLFPSGAVAWNVTEEDFFPDGAISDLKIRLGYGITGNQEIPNHLFREQLSISGSSTYSLGGVSVPSVVPTNFANPDLKWEQTRQLNVGVDMRLFGDRVSGSVDVYEKRTTDLLLQFSTAAPSVVNNQWANVGEVKNTGIEFSLDAILKRSRDVSWDANINFARNVNEVVTLSDEQFTREFIRTGRSSGVVSGGAETQIIMPGLPLNAFWGRKYMGVDQNGMELYENDGELMHIGSPHPDFTFGISSSFRWKNFDSSISFRGVIGNDVYNNTAAEFSYMNAFPGTNVLRSALDNEASRNQTAQFSSRWLEDGSYLRLSNLTVGYTFNTANVPFLSNARVYVTGNNLFVITGYSGFDPEVQANTNLGGSAPLGIDYMTFPRSRTFQIGASLTF